MITLNEWALLGLCVDNTSDANECFVTVFVMPLFVDHATPIILTNGYRLRSLARNSDRWEAASIEQINELLACAEYAVASEITANQNLQSYLRNNVKAFSTSENLNLLETALLSQLLLGEDSLEVARVQRRIDERIDQNISWHAELKLRVERCLVKPRDDVVSDLRMRKKRFLEKFYPSLTS